ncbi:MAG: disulfide bond formation protein B, partial [Zwartia sp.]
MITLTNSRNSLTTRFSTWLNLVALLAICGSLLAAFYYQIVLNELPCPLCQLQRVALTLAGIG